MLNLLNHHLTIISKLILEAVNRDMTSGIKMQIFSASLNVGITKLKSIILKTLLWNYVCLLILPEIVMAVDPLLAVVFIQLI